jgi:hypothetical protein
MKKCEMKKRVFPDRRVKDFLFDPDDWQARPSEASERQQDVRSHIGGK